MKTQFVVLNPLDGGYTNVDTIEAAASALANNAFALYMSQAHNNPISVVQTHDDGKETWFTAQGEQLPNKEDTLAELKRKSDNLLSMAQATSISVTKLGGA